MFCYQCGQQIPTNGRFCPNCGTAAAGTPAPAPAAPPPVAYAPAPPPPQYWTPPPVAAPPAPPPVVYAAFPTAIAPPTAEPTTERLIYYESAVRTKVPDRSFWNHDILITERRLIARKTGWKGNLTKGMARSAAGGLVNAIAATALYALDFGMSQVKTPKYDDAPVVAVSEVDDFRDKEEGAVEFCFDDLSRCIFRKRGFITPATVVLQSAQGELLTEVNFFKELKPILRQVLGARCSEE
jgi:hypothetical protein